MDAQPPLTLPLAAHTADNHHLPSILHVPRQRPKPAQKPPRPDPKPSTPFETTQPRIQALLAKLSLMEQQNSALRTRCQKLERELDRVAASIGSSPAMLRPPRPTMHRCQPRPGDFPAPLRFPGRREWSDGQVGKVGGRTSGMSSISELLDEYSEMGQGVSMRGRKNAGGSPNFSRPHPGRSVTEGQGPQAGGEGL